MSLGPSVNMWVGDNGVGKTSVLEAVYFVVWTKFCFTSSEAAIAFDQQS